MDKSYFALSLASTGTDVHSITYDKYIKLDAITGQLSFLDFKVVLNLKMTILASKNL